MDIIWELPSKIDIDIQLLNKNINGENDNNLKENLILKINGLIGEKINLLNLL